MPGSQTFHLLSWARYGQLTYVKLRKLSSGIFSLLRQEKFFFFPGISGYNKTVFDMFGLQVTECLPRGETNKGEKGAWK